MAEDLTIDKLAAIAKVSPNYFSTQFRQSLSTTPHQYVIQQKITKAKLGVVSGAATQIIMTLLAFSYQPVVGFGEVAIILVGQSLGANNPAWAKKVGNAVIRLSVFYMVIFGLILAVAGKWVIAPFVSANDPNAVEIMAIAPKLL